MTNPQTKRGRANQMSAQKIVRRCKCGRVITGNAGWYSHLNANSGSPEHGYAGRV